MADLADFLIKIAGASLEVIKLPGLICKEDQTSDGG